MNTVTQNRVSNPPTPPAPADQFAAGAVADTETAPVLAIDINRRRQVVHDLAGIALVRL
jgi:hypothetical protein